MKKIQEHTAVRGVSKMSKYIDIEFLKKKKRFLTAQQRYIVRMTDIYNAPTIDIVRCKDCKWLRYCETEDLDLYLDCDKPDGGGIPQSEKWFCADGEREGE